MTTAASRDGLRQRGLAAGRLGVRRERATHGRGGWPGGGQGPTAALVLADLVRLAADDQGWL
jgi:hypothetical protein